MSQSATSTCYDPLRCCGISHQRLGRVGLLVDDNESELIVDPHTEADLGEGCSPVGW